MALRHATLDRRLGRLGKATRRGPTFSEVVAEADRPYRAAHIFGLFARALAGTDTPPAPAAPIALASAARPSTPAIVAPPREPVRPDQHTLVSWEEARRIPWLDLNRPEPNPIPLVDTSADGPRPLGWIEPWGGGGFVFPSHAFSTKSKKA